MEYSCFIHRDWYQRLYLFNRDVFWATAQLQKVHQFCSSSITLQGRGSVKNTSFNIFQLLFMGWKYWYPNESKEKKMNIRFKRLVDSRKTTNLSIKKMSYLVFQLVHPVRGLSWISCERQHYNDVLYCASWQLTEKWNKTVLRAY